MNTKIPKGNVCELEVKTCPCLYDRMYCQLFAKRLDHNEKVLALRCEECLKMFPNGGTIVTDVS